MLAAADARPLHIASFDLLATSRWILQTSETYSNTNEKLYWLHHASITL
jgi:hypothetical protein